MFRGPELGTCCVLVATFCHCLFLARSLKYAIGYRKSLDFKQNSRPFKKSPQFCVLSTNSWRNWSFYGLIIFVVALNSLYVRFSVNSKIRRHEPLPVSKNITRCVFKRQSMFVPLSLQNLSSSCHTVLMSCDCHMTRGHIILFTATKKVLIITGGPSSKYEHWRTSTLLRNSRNIRICMEK